MASNVVGWLTFRSLASSDGTVVLSYDALRQYLPSAPGSKRAALETVSRAVLCLRLSTWIALVEYRRNPMTGFSMASHYAVRNQPLAFDDACMEDEDYAQMRYEALTGWKAPAAGGPPSNRWLSPAQRAEDSHARQAISRELGHERIQITATYLGR